MDKRSRNTMLVSVIALALVLIGVTYAYFSARITGLESASTISLTAGRMGIEYSEGDENITFSNIYPRSEEWVTKTITLTGYNTTINDMEYSLGINVINSTFKAAQLSISLTGVGENGTKIQDIANKPIPNQHGIFKIGNGLFNAANGDTHVYTLKIYFKDNGKDQNFNQDAVFNGKIIVTSYSSNPCYTDNYQSGGTNEIGTVFSTDQYTYVYKKYYLATPFIGVDPEYLDLSEDGWWAVSTTSYNYLANGTSSSDTLPITEKLCTSINDKPIVSTSGMFWRSRASSVDLSSFDTSKVTDMSYMMGGYMTNLDVSFLDTSKVKNMSHMFQGISVSNLDLTYLDTSHVTNMSFMFDDVLINGTLDLSSFNTSNVTNMSYMLAAELGGIDLTGWDTSNVSDMHGLFYYSSLTNIDLSNFDTSNVTNMGWMFADSEATSINLRNFDTSKVTDMDSMFAGSQATTLDLSSFATSNVTMMSNMFQNSEATTGYARTQADADRFNNVAGSLSNGNNPNSNIPNTLTFIVK